MSEIDVPETWTQINVEDEVQLLKAFQRRDDGLVLTVEKGTTSDRYAASFLPENFKQDNQVVRRYGDDGYLISSDDLEEVKSEVQNWMEENAED